MSTKTQTFVGVGAAAAIGLVAALGIASATGYLGDDEPAAAPEATTSTTTTAPPEYDEAEHGAPLATLKPYVVPVPVGDMLVDCVVINAGGVTCNWANPYPPVPLPNEPGGVTGE